MNRTTTPFGFSSTAAEVVAGVDLTGKRMIVTGASSGIGIEAARALAGAGADVTLAVRNVDEGERTAAEIRSSTGSTSVAARRLELSDQRSVRAFVADWEGPLHILVNNAGIMALPTLERTKEGWEMQFATNFLGHFALTVGLHRSLAAAKSARVVSVSSNGNLIAPVIFDDLHFNFLPYDPLLAYGQSKTACALLAVEATRRWARDGILANALNPRGDRHKPTEVYGWPKDASRTEEDTATGCGDLRIAGNVSTPRGNRRALFRGLQRGDSGLPPLRRLHGRRPLCARSD